MHDEQAIESEVVKLLRYELEQARERIRVLEATTVEPMRELRNEERRRARAIAFSHTVDVRSATWPLIVGHGQEFAAKQLVDLLVRAELPAARSWADLDSDGRELIRYHRDVVGELKPFDHRTPVRPRAVQRTIDYGIAVLG